MLRKLAAEGLTSGQIAAEMGMTRSGIMGKLRRAKIALTSLQARMVQGKAPRPPRKRERKPRPSAPSPIHEGPMESPPIVSEESYEELLDGVTMVELESHHCRYPMGEVGSEDFRFCGIRRLDDCNYCRKHKLICMTQTPRQKQMRAA